MNERHEWIEKRAYEIWESEGRPYGQDLTFWLQAEMEYDHCCCGQLCTLTPGSCPHQMSLPTTGGKHVSVCTRKDGMCKNKATNVNKVA